MKSIPFHDCRKVIVGGFFIGAIYKWGNMNHKLVIHRQELDGERTFTYT